MYVIFTMFAFSTTNFYTFTMDCNVRIRCTIMQFSTVVIKSYNVQNDTPNDGVAIVTLLPPPPPPPPPLF